MISAFNTVKILLPAVLAFWVGIAATPLLTNYLYKYKVWKKKGGKKTLDGKAAEEFNRLHAEGETKTPRMGGIVVWGSVIITTLTVSLIAHLLPGSHAADIDYLSRNETWIPFFTLGVGALVGFINDWMDVTEKGHGMPLRYRLMIIFILSLFIGWWFWAKLGVTVIDVPFGTPFTLGIFIVPFFILLSLCLYASGVIDGIDGLSPGVFASIFASYTIIAFGENQIALAGFCASVVGGLLAFLWFNIPPARFYMSETGTMALTLTIAVIAFMTDNLGSGVGIAVLPIIAALLFATVASNVLQVFWKKVFHRKLFRIAPLHHHFEAIGWPGYKVVMRYWVLSVICAFAGVIVALISI